MTAGLASAPPPGVVGPNAIIQLGSALLAGPGPTVAERVYARAGLAALLAAPPAEMLDQRVPARLFAALWDELGTAAAPVASEAGRLTADYVIANRIPRLARGLLRLLPPRMAVPLLLSAIRRNAWTFAGSGRCRVASRPVPLIEISNNPLAMPDCTWHRAVLERMFDRLAAPGARVRHTACCTRGAPACRFEIDLAGA